MNGFQITLFTQQNRRYKGKVLAEWLVELAKEIGVQGATVVAATEGYGKTGRIHSAHFFELADQPLEVIIAASSEQSEKLFARLNAETVNLFYVKAPVEFGTIGGGSK